MSSSQIEFYDDLKVHLQNVQSGDKAIRSTAEEQVRLMRDQDTRKFLASLVKEIADESNSEQARQMACVICKNLIVASAADAKYLDLWVQLEPIFKQNIKQAVLQTLASPSKSVRTQIASLVAAIASIEIPRGEWAELIANLCTNSSHDQLDVRLSSLQTIGYICEEIDPEDLSAELKNQVMLALTNNIKSDDDFNAPCKLAIKALLIAIAYTAQNFQVTQERDFIMQKVFEALESKDSEIREVAMQCLVEIGRQEYQYVQHYFQKIAEVTAKATTQDEGKVGAQGIEFWTTLAEEELNRKKKGAHLQNYIFNCKEDLIKLLLTGISNVQIDDEDEEDDEWGVNMSAGCCLQKISLLLQQEVMPPIVEFVQANILSADWKSRYAALIALGAITEGPERAKFAEILIPSIPNLLSMFKDTSVKVREAISWVVSKICEHHSDVLIQDQNVIDVFLTTITASLQDRPRVSNQSCAAIEKLAESLQPVDPSQPENQLTKYFEQIGKALLDNSGRDDFEGTNNNLIQSSYSALISLCQHSCKNSSNSIHQMLIPMLQLLEQTVSNPQGSASRVKDQQDMLFGILQVILVKIGHLVDEGVGNKIVELIIMIFKSQKRVTENGLICYSGLCIGLGERVNVKDFGEYLLWALEGDDEESARVACGIVSDIGAALKDNVEVYMSSFVPHLLKVLKSEDRDRKTKLQALNSLGDLAIYAGAYFCSHYLEDTLKILASACTLSLQTTEFQNDPDTLEYLEELRLNLIETYTTITQGVVDVNMQAAFQTYIPALFTFMQTLSNVKDFNVFISMAGLLGDLVACQGRLLEPFINQEWVRVVLESLRQSPNEEAKQLAEWAWERISQVVAAGGSAQ